MKPSNWSLVLMTSIIVDSENTTLNNIYESDYINISSQSLLTSIPSASTTFPPFLSSSSSSSNSPVSADDENLKQSEELKSSDQKKNMCQCEYLYLRGLVSNDYSWWTPPSSSELNIYLVKWNVWSHFRKE